MQLLFTRPQPALSWFLFPETYILVQGRVKVYTSPQLFISALIMSKK